MNSKVEFFQSRLVSFQEKIDRLQSKSNVISAIRIISFISFIIAFIIILNIKVLTPLIVFTFLYTTGFGILVKWHNRIKATLRLYEKIIEINKEEVDRLAFKLNKIYDGSEFTNDKHEYSDDLDLYGKNSLFQIINRAGTPEGIKRLKSWLEVAASDVTIETRQESAQELKPLVDWRQKVEAHGRSKNRDTDQGKDFLQWLDGKDKIRNNSFFRIIPYVFIGASSVLLIAALMEILPFSMLLLPIIIGGSFLLKIKDYSSNTYNMTTSGLQLLQSIEQILILIEGQSFSHKHLDGLKAKLFGDNIAASTKIEQLRKILDYLNLRGNQIYHLFNVLFLLDFILLKKAERWRFKYKNDIAKWFGIIAEFESLNSIAAFSFANEGYVFPKISRDSLEFSSKELGHPLIPEDQRIYNDFRISEKGMIGIVTGSNMAGKSTFLRTIGINAVLAFAGAPVCADSLQISNFQVFTSMRTKDNLEENISSFYAELLRLKMLLENINDERPTLFLLDEILKGTNSTDRHIGAESLAIQLSKLNAFGLISTHDLKLGQLKVDGDKLTNYNFSSEINGEEIIFDYKLRDGICQSTNASQLMAKIGIQINV